MKPTKAQIQAMAELIVENLESEYIWDKLRETALDCAEEDDVLKSYGGDMHALFDAAADRVQVKISKK